MEGFEALTTTLAIVAGLALGVERVLEVLKHIVDLDNKYLDKSAVDNTAKQAEEAIVDAQHALQEALHIIENKNIDTDSAMHAHGNALHPIDAKAVEAQHPCVPADAELEDQLPAPRIPVLAATPREKSKTSKALFLQLMGAGLGIVFAQVFNIHLVASFMAPLGGSINFSPLLDILISGIIIGGGSQPVHLLMRFMTTRKLPEMPATAVISTPFNTMPVMPASNVASEWVPIPYRGGVKAGSLENVHQRGANPNLIVYHHTAMHSDSSFQDVVDEYLVRKKWLTGYHCVIMPDGQIKAFCRWDRAGNHAKGNNQRSLGLAFHGNFHTKTGDLYSNADGRYGHQEPSAAQLVAAARVVALWTHLYDDIDLDFEKNILAHHQVSDLPLAGPGSNFPVKVFQNQIRHFYELWAESDHAHACITTFKQKDYLFVNQKG